jgi:hypothetical protein
MVMEWSEMKNVDGSGKKKVGGKAGRGAAYSIRERQALRGTQGFAQYY